MISIIVPVYNVEKYLERCVQSILNQTYKDYEILLIDDGSTDNSGDICEHLAAEYEKVRVIHQKNRGAAAARNLGLEKSNGEYIAFIDSDDYIDVKYLEILFQNLNIAKADISCCEYMQTNRDNLSNKNIRNITELFSGDEALQLFLKKELTSPCAKLYKKKLFRDIQFPEGKINEDIPTVFKCFAKAGKIIYIDDPLYYYYKNTGSITRRAFDKQCLDLLDSWKEVVEISCSYSGETQKWADFRLNKSYFTLLGIIAYYGYSKNLTAEEQKELLQDILTNYKKYFSYKKIVGLKGVPFNRKLAMIAFRINFKLCYVIGELFRLLKTL